MPRAAADETHDTYRYAISPGYFEAMGIPITYVGVAALLTGVSMIACAMPAWRAARVRPSVALRFE